MVGRYQIDSTTMLLNQFVADNPTLADFVAAGVRLGRPRAIAPVGNRNTEITLYPSPLSPYRGSVKVLYRRLSLGKLFNSQTPEVQFYVNADANAVPCTVYDLIPHFNDTHGFLFTQADLVQRNVSWVDTGLRPTRSGTVEFRAKTDSLCYVGSMTVLWVQGPSNQEIFIGAGINYNLAAVGVFQSIYVAPQSHSGAA